MRLLAASILACVGSLGLALPGGSLSTHVGDPFSLEALHGKTVVLNFIFTHCSSVCLTQTQTLVRVREALPESLRERVHFVSVSIDPTRDTPAVLREFAEKFEADLTSWSFVTGPAAEIDLLKERYAVQALPEGADLLDHRADVRLIDPRGRHLQTYAGRPLDEERLVREIAIVDEMFRNEKRP